MDFPLFIRHRLRELGTEQRDLAAAAQVTESYISQLLTGKKPPPAPERTDIYDKMETFSRLPDGKLAALANLLRTDALKRKLTDPPAPLFKAVRELILRKCEPRKEQSIRAIFFKEPSGPSNASSPRNCWMQSSGRRRRSWTMKTGFRQVARLTDRSDEQVRVTVLEFLEADILNVSVANAHAAGNRSRIEDLQRRDVAQPG